MSLSTLPCYEGGPISLFLAAGPRCRAEGYFSLLHLLHLKLELQTLAVCDEAVAFKAGAILFEDSFLLLHSLFTEGMAFPQWMGLSMNWAFLIQVFHFVLPTSWSLKATVENLSLRTETFPMTI